MYVMKSPHSLICAHCSAFSSSLVKLLQGKDISNRSPKVVWEMLRTRRWSYDLKYPYNLWAMPVSPVSPYVALWFVDNNSYLERWIPWCYCQCILYNLNLKASQEHVNLKLIQPIGVDTLIIRHHDTTSSGSGWHWVCFIYIFSFNCHIPTS